MHELIRALCCCSHCMYSGHQSFSNNRDLNDLVGNIAHASILVPYHGWRVSHRKHHGNHGHVENDESWHPTTKSQIDEMVRHSLACAHPQPLQQVLCECLQQSPSNRLHTAKLGSLSRCLKCCSAVGDLKQSIECSNSATGSATPGAALSSQVATLSCAVG